LKFENLPVDGEPAAKVSWYFKARNLAEDSNATITNVDYFTSIEIKNTVRKMTGMYLIRAVNEHGKDEAEVEFVVLGPPGPPRDLEVSPRTSRTTRGDRLDRKFS